MKSLEQIFQPGLEALESALAKFTWLAIGEIDELRIHNCQNTGRVRKIKTIAEFGLGHIDCVQFVHLLISVVEPKTIYCLFRSQYSHSLSCTYWCTNGVPHTFDKVHNLATPNAPALDVAIQRKILPHGRKDPPRRSRLNRNGAPTSLKLIRNSRIEHGGFLYRYRVFKVEAVESV